MSLYEPHVSSGVSLNVCIRVFGCVCDDGSCFLSPADGPLWLPLRPAARGLLERSWEGLSACTYVYMFVCVYGGC